MNRWTRRANPNFVAVVNAFLRFDRSPVEFYFQIRIDARNPVNTILTGQLNHGSGAGRALRQTDLHIAVFTSANANMFAHDDLGRPIVQRRDVNYQPVYLRFCCHRFGSFGVPDIKSGARMSDRRGA